MTRWRGLRHLSSRDLLGALLVLSGLVVFVVGVYVVVVLGGGVLIGHTSSPQVGLSVLATVVVALALPACQSRLEAYASRLVHGGRPSPYDVLNRFSAVVTSSNAAAELPARMAKVLADGTGAEWAQVWLVMDDRLRLAATWPPGASADDGLPAGVDLPGMQRREVRQGGDLLGLLVVKERESAKLTPIEERLFTGLANQAGLVLRGVRLRAELESRAVELSVRGEELRQSRERLVDAQDDERRRLERDIHDGAQQHLVALAVNLSLAQRLAGGPTPDRADRLIEEQEQAARETIDTIARLSRGIYPRLLGESGLVSALQAAADTSPVPVTLTADGVGRYAPTVEATAYFCVLEALQNCAKHAHARAVSVALYPVATGLRLVVEDDGVGYDDRRVSGGGGIANMRDRIESGGGTLTTTSAPERGARVEAWLPAVRQPVESRS